MLRRYLGQAAPPDGQLASDQPLRRELLEQLGVAREELLGVEGWVLELLGTEAGALARPPELEKPGRGARVAARSRAEVALGLRNGQGDSRVDAVLDRGRDDGTDRLSEDRVPI